MSVADDPARCPLPAVLGRLLHDLRGPLNSLTMHVEVLKRTVRDDCPSHQVKWRRGLPEMTLVAVAYGNLTSPS